MRLKHGYFTPDDYYEALVGRLLHDGAEWCDVGCGRNIFPENPDLARQYASRCRFVFGIDPDDNVRENALVNEYFQGFVEDCPIERQFDLVTLRMVAEHIENPEAALSRLARLLKPSGHAVIYTPHKWAPMSIVANVTPFGLHNPLKRLLWNSEARDTFPTQYKLNTRKDIDRVCHDDRTGTGSLSAPGRLPDHELLSIPEPPRTRVQNRLARRGNSLPGGLHPYRPAFAASEWGDGR